MCRAEEVYIKMAVVKEIKISIKILWILLAVIQVLQLLNYRTKKILVLIKVFSAIKGGFNSTENFNWWDYVLFRSKSLLKL